MTLNSPRTNETLGQWTLARRLGHGGNGEVWKANGPNGNSVAIKILRKTSLVAYSRFRDEIKIMHSNHDIPGILPVIDDRLPDDFTANRAWYAMPLAEPLQAHIRGKSTTEIAILLASAADTLATLHSRDICHRDIKPANLLYLDDRAVLGDFGLVDYPDKADITGHRQDLGPRWTMAPEVRRHQADVDLKAADVYSLAKTLWILLTQQNQGFDGQYAPSGDIALRRFIHDTYLSPLDELLSECTNHDPRRRPTAAAFADRLRTWSKIATEYRERNPREWAEVLARLFPLSVPKRAIWEDPDDIVKILSLLGSSDNLNHLFFPSGGGLDLRRAEHSRREPECIELILNGSTCLLKPHRLMFESFHTDPQWDYFRLEAGPLKPSGVYGHSGANPGYEEVTDVGGTVYANWSCWENDDYMGNTLPPRSRRLVRYFGGSFVIFQKTSIYNMTPSTYDARHNTMTADEFRQHIQEAILHLAKQRSVG